MNLLRTLMLGTLGVVMGALTLAMVACQALVFAAVLGISRLAELVGGHTRLAGRVRPAAQVRGRTIEGEYTVHGDAGHPPPRGH